jgi:ribonucleotide reductase alpha subunit
MRFLDRVIDKSSYPTDEIAKWVQDNRPVGLGKQN